MIAQKNPEIRQTANTLYTLSADEATRAEYEAQLKARRDLHAKVAYAYDDGLAKGIEKGREETARNALAKGMPLELVQDITGIDAETLKSLAEQPGK